MPKKFGFYILIILYLVSVGSLILLTYNYHEDHHTDLTHRVVAFSANVVLVTLIFAAIVLYINNRRLKQANKTLYHLHLDNVDYRKHEKQQRELYEKVIDELKQEIDFLRSNEQQRYKNSSLDDHNRQDILSKIINVMEYSDKIFDNDFDLNTLADMVGTNYKYVSQVINQEFNKNFSAYLSDYRVQEACRRLNDHEHYGNNTIEAVAESVGFKSRSNFILCFKRVTGMTPSDYQKQAKNN